MIARTSFRIFSRTVARRIQICLTAMGLFSFHAPAWAEANSPLKVTDLRCESLVNPLGIDETMPRLSWILHADGDSRNRRQTAYRVLVASTPENLKSLCGDLWDSGKVQSDASIFVHYRGGALQSGQPCYWKVRVWDERDMASDWSLPAFWSMGLLHSSDWRAKWIGIEESSNRTTSQLQTAKWIWFPEGNTALGAPVGARFFRKVFNLPPGRQVQKARLLFTADDQCTVYVNGYRAGEARSFRFGTDVDATKWLTNGSNVIAARAANTDWDEDPNPAGFIASLLVEFDQGEPLLVATDSAWRCSRPEVAGWNSNSFDDTGWSAARVVAASGDKPWGEVELASERRLPARMLRHEFTIEKAPIKAVVYFSGLGFSELYLNGEKVGDEVLSPGLTDYSKRVFYRTFDVTDRLKLGPNAIGAILGNGRFYAPRLREPTYTLSYGFPMLRLQLRLTFADGTTREVYTDGAWKATPDGPIRANNEYDGEEYDARREIPGWCSPGFAESNWVGAQELKGPDGAMTAQMIEPMRVIETIKPVSISEPTPGIYVFDFGQNIAGWGRLRAYGSAGSTVRLKYAERLNADGTVNQANLRSARGEDIYTFHGGGLESYEPRFTYHGFRYVQTEGLDSRPVASTLEARVVHDDLKRTGTFECSESVLNGIYRNVVWTLRAGYRSIPADCPNRDERQGWLGDRGEECRGETYVFDINALYRKWLNDMADAQDTNGSLPDICPAYWPIRPDDVTWPSASVMIPGTLRDQYGDTDTLKRHYTNIQSWIDYMWRFVTNGIIRKDAYKDWCVPPENQKLILTKDPSQKTGKAILATAYLYHDLALAAQYAELLGRRTDAKKYRTKAQELRSAFNREFFHTASGDYANGTQTASILPLSFGMVPHRYENKVFESLIQKIRIDSRKHIGTGMVGGQWLLRTLSDGGRADLAYILASQSTYPSWGYMLENGATTIWELWNGNTAEMEMNSGNHIMLVGDFTTWLYEKLAGIRPDPDHPGFKHFYLRCEPVEGLHFVKAEHDSPYGTIRSAWKRKDTHFAWSISVPVNTTATLTFPAPRQAILEKNLSLKSTPALRVLSSTRNQTELLLGSGDYEFQTK